MTRKRYDLGVVTQAQQLWQRLAAFEFDREGVSLPFSRRLARENGWTHANALAAIEEYRRFVFLAMVAGHPVTPSDEVDQVWHLHLCYTRSYWEDMCGELLGRPLHHGPTRGGAEEGRKFDKWYGDTLASYERLFKEPPPQSFWPPNKIRFQRREWRRVDVADAVLFSRRRLRHQVVVAASVTLLLSVAGCTSLLGDDIGTLIMMGSVFGVFFLIWHLAKTGSSGGGDGGCAAAGGGACGFTPGTHDAHDGGSAGGGSADGGSGCGGGGCGGGCGD